MSRRGVSTEEEFRALLDGHGLLREGTLEPPTVDKAMLVFAQANDARFEIERWDAQARRFFDARVGLTVDKQYGAAPPTVDAARIVIARGAQSGVRLVFGRPRAEGDIWKAIAIETRQGAAGLSDLAKRCNQVWLIDRETDEDPLALRLAAILASAALGPILDPKADALFGVRTAREKLAARRE
jgi:hypothetical protein